MHVQLTMSLSGFSIYVTILGIFTEQQLVAGQTVQVMSTDYQTHNLISPFSISDKSIAVHNHEVRFWLFWFLLRSIILTIIFAAVRAILWRPRLQRVKL